MKKELSNSIDWQLPIRILFSILVFSLITSCNSSNTLVTLTQTPSKTPTLTPTETITPTATATSTSSSTPTITLAPTRIGGGGGKIAYNVSKVGIFVMNADGTDTKQITGSLGFGSILRWSGDGKRIVFVSTFTSGSPKLITIQMDGTEVNELGSYSTGVDLSPDEKKIVFVERSSSNCSMFVENADHSNRIKVSQDGSCDDFPHWAPDGEYIAFTAQPRGAALQGELYIMKANGSGRIRLTNNGGYNGSPSWSPDGTQIAFANNGSIILVNSDGSGQVRLPTGPGSYSTPAWSPDGRKIAFQSNRDGNWEIYTMNLDGTQRVRLTKSPQAASNPRWQPGIQPTSPTIIPQLATPTVTVTQ